ncbi:inactive TPR repeat-containing thioredoxin TTL3-like [Euphorbia lathyris]|uniref:inactive TPR repeat-containing thioredoxin TTL3-like n=1 Tax=Euphorbia lathyris TaxID=212925 RepID=UPI00331366E8
MSLYSKISPQQAIDDSSTTNKLDFKQLDLAASPVSPLAIRTSVTETTSSSTSLSSGSVSSTKSNQLPRRPENAANNSSGDLSSLSETSPARHDTSDSTSSLRYSRPVHRRSVSAGAPLIYSGSSFASANNGTNVPTSVSTSSGSSFLPTGNICPSRKILRNGLTSRVADKTDILGTGTGNYGHGNIMRSGGCAKLGSGGRNGGSTNNDPEELKKAGNEMYTKGSFVEALALYDKAILLAPENAAYRSNRAAALTAIGRLGEAVRECEEAVRLDPAYARAHQRLASLYLRLGLVEIAKHSFSFNRQQPAPADLEKLQSLEKHINRCADARKISDWKVVLREADAAITIADYSPQLVACKAEAFFKLYKLEDADSTISNIPKLEYFPPQTKFFGMVAEAYVLYVQAQIEMALGRFENAVLVAEKAGLIDCSNVDICMALKNVKMVARARSRGNDLFRFGKYEEASSAYGEGLKYDPANPVLYCNRAVCWSKIGLWEKSIEDCNQALRIQPNYTKALFRRAASNGKIGRWTEAVKDYEILRKELPEDNEVLESLNRAQIALKKSHVVYDAQFSGEVEDVSNLNKFQTAISSPGIFVVHFKAASDEQCEDISGFVNMLCIRYPSIRFLKVDVEESLAVAKAECIKKVPTFKIYKNGERVKEIICPTHHFLEDSVRSYCL